MIKVPQDLSTVNCIRLTASETSSTWFMRYASAPNEPWQEVNVKGRFISGGPPLACQLALEGCGVSLLDENLASVYVNAGQLVRVLPEWQLIEVQVQVQALTPSRLIPARVRRFTELLSQTLAGH